MRFTILILALMLTACGPRDPGYEQRKWNEYLKTNNCKVVYEFKGRRNHLIEYKCNNELKILREVY